MSHAKPIEVHERNGNPSKKKLPVAPVVASGGSKDMPLAPAGLSAKSKAVWDDVWGYAYWLDPVADLQTMTRYCFLLDRYTELEDEVNSMGVTSLGSSQQTVSNPSLKDQLAMAPLLLKYENDLCLTPAGRARGGVAKPEATVTDALANFW